MGTENTSQKIPHKLTEATRTQSHDENIPTSNNEGAMATTQKIGFLNFTPINPGNATRENHSECGEQPVTITTKAPKLTPNFDGSQTIKKKAAPTMNPPTELVVLAVEDITVDARNGEDRDTQHDVTPKHGHPPRQSTELHRPPAGSQEDTHDDTFYDTRFPPEMPHGKNNPGTSSAEIRATANAEIATICSTILLGKLDADGSYNVNGQVMSIQELQNQLGKLQDRN